MLTPTPTHTVELIGPTEAHKLMEGNTKNRAIRNNIVTTYAKAMAAGNWPFDGAPVRIAPDDTLLDGQHRLLAVIESGVTLEFSIWRNVNPDTQNVMDTGRKRSIADALHLRGEINCAALGAVLGLAYRWDLGYRGSNLTNGTSKTQSQIPDLLKYLDLHPGIRASINPGYFLTRRVHINASVTTLAHYIFTEIDPADAEGFFGQLASGANLAEDSPIFALRETLKRADKPGVTTAPSVYLALLIKAWNAYREGRPVKLLLFKSGGASPESFPEPI